MAVILVISVQGSRMVSSPNRKAVKICTINSFFAKKLAKVHIFLHICKFFTTFAFENTE